MSAPACIPPGSDEGFMAHDWLDLKGGSRYCPRCSVKESPMTDTPRSEPHHTPLSVDELAEVRTRAGMAVLDVPPGRTFDDWHETETMDRARLLATLDEARKRKSAYVRVPEERFWEKVDRSDEGGCWPWTGAVNPEGYGLFRATQGGKAGGASLAHRYAYRLVYGTLDASKVVMHTCDNPPCVRPDHLRVGSHGDNIADKVGKGRDRTPSGQQNGRSGTGRRQAERIKQLEAELAAERAARQPAADTSGLRAALDGLPWAEMLHDLDGTQHYIMHETSYDGDDMEGVACITGPEGHGEDAEALIRAILAALSGATPEATAPGPDVERLYRAMVNLDTDDPGAFNVIAISEPDTRPVAEALANEYARLTEQQGSGSSTGEAD